MQPAQLFHTIRLAPVLIEDSRLILIEVLTSLLELSKLPPYLFDAEQLGSKSSQTNPSKTQLLF